MKKLLVLIAVALVSCYAFAAPEASDSAEVKKSKEKKYSFSKNYSHWSLAISGGFNFLMSERDQLPGEEITNYKDNFHGGLNFEAEYTINPIWGVGLGYLYAPINKNCIFAKDYYGIYPEKDGQSHQVYAIVNVNLLNLFSRYRTHTEWNWYGGAGIGLVTYNTSEEFITDNVQKWSVIPMFNFQSSIEYSPISSLSIFLKAAMATYLRDNINVCADGPLNDWNLYGGLGLRWNINANKKQHVRVTDMNTYEGGGAADNNAQDTATQNRVKKLEDQLNDLKRQAAGKNKCAEGLDSIRKQANTNADDIKKLRRDLESAKRSNNINSEIADNSVYFANNSSVVTPEYQLIVEKVARVMLANPDVKVELTSVCSKPGSSNLNDGLGKRRIEAVKSILVNKYKIDASRITSKYNGQIFEGLESQNRRCDMKLKY